MTGLEQSYCDALAAVIRRRRKEAGLTCRALREFRANTGVTLRRVQRMAELLGTTASALMREAEDVMGWADA